MNDLSAIQARFGDLGHWMSAPDFWLAKPSQALPFIGSLRTGRDKNVPPAVRTIGKTAGGRDIIAIEYGEKETIVATSGSLQSSLAAGVLSLDETKIFPESFYGAQRRKRPVLALQGAIHGSELSGTVASLNLCRVIESGSDLRGKAWPKLRELARASRIVIIPWLNRDGAERFPLATTVGAPPDLLEALTHGLARDGSRITYPEHKHLFPYPLERVAFLGTYFNDAGVNLQYDFCLPQRQPETVAWMEYYLAEKPDGILIWHCNAGSMLSSPDYYLPEGFQHEFSRLGGAVRQRLLREGYEIGRLSWAGLPGIGRPVLDQANATYHVCGGMPILCEMPDGSQLAPFTHEQILDIGLITIEEVLFYAHHDGLRPYELWTKVKKTLKQG